MAYISLGEAYEQEFGVKNNKKTPQIKQTMSLDEAYKQEFGENSHTGKMSLDEAFADTFKPGEIMPMPFYKQAADYGLRTLGGVSSGLWNVAASGTDYVARLSDALSKTVGLSEGKELSPVAKKAREAAKWLAGQGKSASDYALQGRDPSLLDAVAQGLGSSAAFMLPSMAVGRAVQVGGIIPKALAYAATKGGLESITEGGSVFGAQLDKGATPEEAHAAALRAELLQFPINFASDAVGDLIGGGAAKGALKEATTQTLKKGAVETGRKILGRGTGELVQEAFQGVTSDRLSERKPDGTPWTWGDVFKAVPEMAGNIPEAMLKEGVPAFISAALIGAGEGVYGHRQQKKEQAAVQNAVQAKQAEILEDIQKNREQEQQRGEQFGISEQLPQQSQIIEPVVNVDLLPQQPKEQMQEQQPTVSETESVQKPKLPPKEERKGLIMWGREKMQELSAPAEFVDGEEQARNPLSDEDLQTYSDIRRALKVNDYGKLAELKAGFDTQQQEAQAEQIQKPDNIVDANEMIEQEQMQEQMQAPVKQQQETNNIINFFNAAGKDMQEQRQYGDGIETDNIVNFNTLEEQAKAEDERLEAESKADAAKRIQEKITDEARDKRNARLVNAIKTKQKDATPGEIGAWIEALPDDEVRAFAGEIIGKQPAGVKKAAINRLNERIEQVKAQESAEQRTAKISVDDISSLQFADESSMGKDDYELNRITGVTYQRQKEASAKRAQNIEELKARKDEPSTREEYEEREKARQGRGKELPIGEYLEREGRPEGEKITPQDRLNYAKYCLKNGYTPDLQTIEPLITEYTKRREIGQKKAEPTPTRAASTPSVPSANVVLREGSMTDAELSGISDAEYEVLKSRRDAQASKKADREARALPGGVAGQAGQEHLYRSAGRVTEQGSTYLDYLQDRGKTDSVQSRLDYVKERRGLGGFYEKAVADSVRTSDARKRTEEQILKNGGNTGGAVSAAAVKTQGKESRVSTQAGDSVNTRFKVVEADDLIASHNEAFGENENYPQELQPRKRGRAASQHQVEHIISNLNPELLGDSKLASDGAPIVGSDNIVESGNGRVLALKLAYGRGQATEKQAQKYRQYLSDNAEQFGLSAEDISSMKKPVLVRERTSDVDRKSFAQNANVSSVATMSSSETALKDADKLDIGMLESLNTDLDVLNSKDFISTFARDVVPKNELGTFIDDRGNLSQDGMRRVKNALFVKAYGDEQTLARMSESTDDNTRNISRALLQASTAVAPVQAKIKDGLLRKDLSMAEHIIQAANTLSSLRDKGMKVSEFLQQGNIFDEGGISPEARQILQFFDKNKQKPNVITNYLKDTARRVAAEGDGNQGSLFGGKQKSLNDILRSAESEATPKQKGLWDDIKKREAARKYIIDDATKQLKATGMEQSEIDSNVALMTAVFETFAEREGIGADELYKMYDIEFRKGDKAKGEDPNKVVMEVRNQEASHGSPADFDEFDFSFMGTGEGYQMFGWGGYFGQDRKMLDKQYRQRLLKNDPQTDIKISLNGRELTNENKNPDVLHIVRRSLVASDFDIKRAVKGIESTIKMQEGWLADGERKFYAGEKQEILGMLRRNKDALKILESETLKIERNENTGQLYDVEIPDDHELLLWDKPMGEQSDVVKKAYSEQLYKEKAQEQLELKEKRFLESVKSLLGNEASAKASEVIREFKREITERQTSHDIHDAVREFNDFTKSDLSTANNEEGEALRRRQDRVNAELSGLLMNISRMEKSHKQKDFSFMMGEAVNGEDFYRKLSQIFGSDKAASLWLLDHGVKGHKFLDGSSRGKGEGTYNFVIWDEKAIQIKKKYYQSSMLNSDVLRQYKEKDAEWINAVSQLVEDARKEGYTHLCLRCMTDESVGKGKRSKGEALEESQYWGDIEQEDPDATLGGTSSIEINDMFDDDPESWAEAIDTALNHAIYPGPLAVIGVNEEMDNKDGRWYERPFRGEDPHEMVVPNARFYGYVEDLLGEAFTDRKTLLQERHQKGVKKGDTPRGSIEFLKNLGTGELSTVINFTALQDKSTCVHELGHLYYRLLADQARRMPDNPEAQTALAMAREFLGTKDGQGALTEDQQEKWANGWINYVAEGKAPNAKLESVFKRFKKWLADLWANMTGRKDKVELTDGIRQVFDWLLTGDAAFDVRYDLDNALALAAEAEKFERLEQDAWQDIDKEYFDAIEAGDMETAQRIIDEQAQRMGYSSDSEYRMSHRAPNSKEDVNLVTLAESDIVPDDYWTTPKYYQYSKEDYESFYKINRAVNSNARGVHMFRAVPKDLKEAAFRNGDWITPSRDYANAEGAQIPGGYRIIEQFVHKDKIWWDGNSICEFGFDDGKNYAYKNTKNNLKLADVVVRDRDGKVVPPSKRFNRMKTETFYQRAHKQQATSDTTKSGVEVVKKAEDKRNYSGIMDIFNSPNIVADRHPRFAVFYRMAKDAYAKQERLRNNWQRAANKIFGKKGYISNQADRESLTEILLTGDAMGKVFSNEELAQLGADTNIIKAYRQIRGLYDNAHRMVSEQRKKYGKDELAYRKGYVPHFFHAWRVIKDGEIVDSHRSMNDAVKAAERLMESDGGKIKVAPALDDFGGQAQSDAITLGDVQYFKFIQKTADTFAMTLEEARDMTKDIAKMQNRSRVFKNALERKGYPGWDKNMEFALRRYLNLSARYIAMDTLKHDGIRMFERTFGRFKSEHSGLANYTKKFLEDALGHPSKIEDSLNEWVRNSPLSKYVKDYIGDRPATVLANSIAKTVAIAKLGFCNASAAMINVTQLIGTNAIIGEANTFRGLVEYLQPTNKTDAIYEALGISDDITMENPSGYSGIHRVGGRLGELSMSLFRIMDNMARKVTVLGAYRKATAEGKSHLEALEYARKVNDDVNFDYSVVDTPHFIRQLGPIGTLLFQFKKYPIKQLELALPGVGKLKGKEQLRYWAYASVMSGLFGLPAFEFIKNLIRGLWDDKDIEIEIKDAVTQSGLPQSVKDTLMYGALSNLGIDVGKRVGMGDFIPSGIEDFTGPSISTGIQLIRSLPKIYTNGSIIDTLEALSPGLSNPYKAFVAGETVDKRRGRTKFVYETTGEKLARATGARPIRESKQADAVRSANYNQRKQSEMEQDAIDAIVEVWNKKNSPEYKRAAERCKKLKITYGRVEEEIQKRRKDEFRRKLESQPKTPAGRNRRAVMESYAGL